MESPYREQHGFWGRGTITAAIILVLVLLAGIVLVVLRVTDNNSGSSNAGQHPTPQTGAAKTPQSSSSVPGQVSDACSLPAGSQTVPEATPQGITWQLYQTVAVPYSQIDGPQRIDGDVARCYADNPLGALIAASQISYRYLIAPNWMTVVNEQVVDNAGRAAYIAERQKVSTQGGNQPGDYDQLAGFKYVTYSPAVAVIEFVSSSSTGVMQASTATVDWVDGDWKLQLQPNGSQSPTALPVTSLVGYSTWSGV